MKKKIFFLYLSKIFENDFRENHFNDALQHRPKSTETAQFGMRDRAMQINYQRKPEDSDR